MATVAERDVIKGGQPPIAETQPETGARASAARAAQDDPRLLAGRDELRRLHDLGGRRHQPGHRGPAGRRGPGDAEGDPASPGALGRGGRRVRAVLPRRVRKASSGAPYVVVFEGSVADERIAGADRRVFLGHGRRGDRRWRGAHARCRPRPGCTALAPGAAATIAIGTCATWGGVPSAEGNPDRRDERHGLPRQGLPERVRPAGDQHPGLRAAGRQLHRDGLRRPALPAGARSAADVRRARPAGVALPRHRAPGLHARRILRGGHLRRALRRSRSASSRSAAGARSSTATSCSAAPSTTWAAA